MEKADSFKLVFSLSARQLLLFLFDVDKKESVMDYALFRTTITK